MNETDIQCHLIRHLQNAGLVFPNFTPKDWWECDLICITKAGYFREYEIKLTKSDFKADAKKARYLRARGRNQPVELKHDQLFLGNERGPRQFWYVCPSGLIEPRELPNFAGLVWVKLEGWPNIQEIRKAPFLHSKKSAPDVSESIRRNGHLRYINLMTKAGPSLSSSHSAKPLQTIHVRGPSIRKAHTTR